MDLVRAGPEGVILRRREVDRGSSAEAEQMRTKKKKKIYIKPPCDSNEKEKNEQNSESFG